ncbi:MAG: hypothetical protein A3Q59_07960 [Methanomethylophilus alvi]|nr:MAG: hypothetical protein A3Q59_07960 [Methanomethylophilus alvi]
MMAPEGKTSENLGMEDEFREFEDSTTELEKGLVSLTAMLNKNGRGTVYFGVDSKGKIIGQDVGRNTLRNISQAINDAIDPPIVAKAKINSSEDGKKYISVSAEGTDRPYACCGSISIRSGGEDRRASMSDLRKMFMSSGDILIRTTSSDQELSFRELCDLLNENGLHAKDDENLHKSLELLNSEGKYNQQGQLLSDQNPAVLAVVIFRGKDRTFMSMRKEFSGHSLLLEVRDVIGYVESLNETFVDIRPEGRIEQKLFSMTAFREAWINACVHNYWVNMIPPAVHIFDDRMEIISYGGKPYWLSDDEFYSGRSMPVNESLMRIFISTRMSEHTGHGIPVIISHYGKDSIHLSNSGIVVTLEFTRERAAASFRSEMPTLTENEKRILDTLRLHPDYTLTKIASLSGMSRSYVGKTVSKMKKMGLVERIGSNKSGSWAVKDRIDRKR